MKKAHPNQASLFHFPSKNDQKKPAKPKKAVEPKRKSTFRVPYRRNELVDVATGASPTIEKARHERPSKKPRTMCEVKGCGNQSVAGGKVPRCAQHIEQNSASTERTARASDKDTYVNCARPVQCSGPMLASALDCLALLPSPLVMLHTGRAALYATSRDPADGSEAVIGLKQVESEELGTIAPRTLELEALRKAMLGRTGKVTITDVRFTATEGAYGLVIEGGGRKVVLPAIDEHVETILPSGSFDSVKAATAEVRSLIWEQAFTYVDQAVSDEGNTFLWEGPRLSGADGRQFHEADCGLAFHPGTLPTAPFQVLVEAVNEFEYSDEASLVFSRDREIVRGHFQRPGIVSVSVYGRRREKATAEGFSALVSKAFEGERIRVTANASAFQKALRELDGAEDVLLRVEATSLTLSGRKGDAALSRQVPCLRDGKEGTFAVGIHPASLSASFFDGAEVTFSVASAGQVKAPLGIQLPGALTRRAMLAPVPHAKAFDLRPESKAPPKPAPQPPPAAAAAEMVRGQLIQQLSAYRRKAGGRRTRKVKASPRSERF
ncbi:MAG: hypothetical protein ABW123_22865 [Cystobacter sp.]